MKVKIRKPLEAFSFPCTFLQKASKCPRSSAMTAFRQKFYFLPRFFGCFSLRFVLLNAFIKDAKVRRVLPKSIHPGVPKKQKQSMKVLYQEQSKAKFKHLKLKLFFSNQEIIRHYLKALKIARLFVNFLRIFKKINIKVIHFILNSFEDQGILQVLDISHLFLSQLVS